MYTIVTTNTFDKAFKKLDRSVQILITRWVQNNLNGCTDPRLHGTALTGDLKGLWRYRIGEYRLICEIRYDELIIMALTVGHRRSIYKQQRQYLHEEEESYMEE